MNKISSFLKINLEITNRNAGLDIMRGSAVLMLLITHSLHFFSNFFPPTSYLSYLVRNEVELFFALSGFLIGNILIKQFSSGVKSISSELVRFYKRRWFRTLPVYYLAVVINLVVGYFITDNYHDFSWKFLCFVQNVNLAYFWFFPASYSLAIEEWFYTLFPILVIVFIKLFKQNTLSAIINTCLVFILVITATRMLIYLDDTTKHLDVHFRKAIITRLDSAVYGVLIAWIFKKFPDHFRNFKVYFLAIGIVLYTLGTGIYIFLPKSVFNYVFYFNLIPISFACFIPWLYYFRFPNIKLNKLFTWLSLLGYSIYCIHLSPLQELTLFYFELNTLVKTVFVFIGYIIITLLSSIIIYKYFEAPLTKLRDKQHNQIATKVEAG